MSVKRSFNSVRLGSCVDKPGAGGETCLTRAIIMGDHDVMREFLEIGADADARNEKKELPLHIALKKNDMKAVLLLLRYNASVFQKQDGMTLREHALKIKNPAIAALADRIEKRRQAELAAMSHGFRC